MKAFLKHLSSFRVFVVLLVVVCWMVPTIMLGYYMGTSLFNAMREKTEALLLTVAEHACVRTMENVDTVVTLSKDVIYDDELAQAFGAYQRGSITKEEFRTRSRAYIERKFGRETMLEFAFFFTLIDPTTVFYTSDNYPEVIDFLHLDVADRVLRIGEQLDTNTCIFSFGDQLYLTRNLINTKQEGYGMLVLGLDAERIFAPATELCAEMGLDCTIRLDEHTRGEADYMDAPVGISSQDGTLLYTLDRSTRDYSMRFQIRADENEVYREMQQFRTLLTLLILLTIPLVGLVLWLVRRRVILPVRELSSAAARMSKGELGVTVKTRGRDELAQLGKTFSSMSTQLKYLVDKSYKEEIALRDARIQAMHSRINSHFLNNALETINWEARMEGSDTISEMVEALSCLLNASMDRSERHLMPLSEELVVADAYFYFIGLRFGERLTVWKHIADDVGDVLVPRLAIQTLVENAIEHGIAPMGGGRITMTAYMRNERLNVEVVNTGRRLSEEDVSRIRRLMSDDPKAEGHIGIRNVAHRLKLLYGDDAVLSIYSDEHAQTVAAFSIPVQYDSNEVSETKLDNKQQ